MYHIPDDKRAKRSAEEIFKGLMKCLDEKPLAKVTVSDINEKSYVSRATFYRLFDSVDDVLVYRCETLIREVTEIIKERGIESLQEAFSILIELSKGDDNFVGVLSANGRMDLLYMIHDKNLPLFKQMFLNNVLIDDETPTYIILTMIGTISSTYHAWILNGKKEDVTELYDRAKKTINLLATVM